MRSAIFFGPTEREFERSLLIQKHPDQQGRAQHDPDKVERIV